jgi:hypothetical protein
MSSAETTRRSALLNGELGVNGIQMAPAMA